MENFKIFQRLFPPMKLLGSATLLASSSTHVHSSFSVSGLKLAGVRHGR